jgi:hypothetical protein
MNAIQKYRDIMTLDGHKAIAFDIVGDKGSIHGIYTVDEKQIFIHLCSCRNQLKELVGIAVNHFKCRDVIFTPLITNGIENKIRGNLKVIPASNPGNPYGEDIKIMECVWET